MTEHQPRVKKRWQHQLIPIGFFWLLFITINATVNQAPNSKDEINFLQILFFLVPLFLALYFTFALILRNRRRGVLIALLVITLLIFRIAELTSFLTVLLAFCLIAFLEWYFGRSKSPQRSD